MLNVPTHQESHFTQEKIICTFTFEPIIVNDQIHNLKNLIKNIKMTTTFWAIFIREQHDLCYVAPRFNKFNVYRYVVKML
jgi:hypothetical protein